MKNDNINNRIVFSTIPDFKQEEENNEVETPSPSAQTLYISLQRLKGGKVATIIESFIGTEADLETLGKLLKNKCGTGGTVKDGLILIQGDQREKIIGVLTSLGYKTKRKGG